MRVLGLGTALPPGRIDQQSAAEVSRSLVGADSRQERLLGKLFQRSGVEHRHSVVVDSAAPSLQWFYPARRGDDDRGPLTSRRMAEYERHSVELAVAAAAAALQDAGVASQEVTHLVTVSCTGFRAPGVDVELLHRLGLPSGVGRVHVGFMGCHGTFNALRVAAALTAADPEARVLVCAVELCSLHFHYGWDSEKLVANALFADGAAALVCGAAEDCRDGIRIRSSGSWLIPDSRGAMTWRIGDHGFEMTLGSEVPGLIREHMPGFLRSWLGPQGVPLEEVQTWAVHPGGPRILTAFESALGLDAEALSVSRAILRDYGNMSSVTIVFILERLLREGARGPAVAVGFGPGLMTETFRFELPAPQPDPPGSFSSFLGP